MYLWRGSTFVFLFSSDINSREDAVGTPNFRVLFLCGRSIWKEIKFVTRPGTRRNLILYTYIAAGKQGFIRFSNIANDDHSLLFLLKLVM